MLAVSDAALPSGSAPLDVKRTALAYYSTAAHDERFSIDVLRRVRIMEVSVQPKADEPSQVETVIVCETEVERDMLNAAGSMHGGCGAYLVDVCASVAIAAAGHIDAVSQTLNMYYHAPALTEHRLRIISRTMSVGSRIASARSEIWDTTSARLCASGVLVKMSPVPSKM
ncbi:HotDog domain-containing protein [Vararia minispora EC-137]|uniref:HotDog domain-containing protein n=1 Tax=Vararia minispora EC-137 TaxID=1314806 RepID=A0ACB8QRW5_9AGAM|nr:HotDog domain-containing protein [Vararia minispora EC-137]